jgi:hypothetical protein
MATGKQALRAFMGLPAVSMPPKDKKADFDRLRAWAEKQPHPEALTVADFVKYNGGPYKPLVNLLADDVTPPPKKPKISLPSGLTATPIVNDSGATKVIKKVTDILEPVSTYKPQALPIDELIKAATALVGAANALEKAYKTAGAKAMAEAINENVALATVMAELI